MIASRRPSRLQLRFLAAVGFAFAAAFGLACSQAPLCTGSADAGGTCPAIAGNWSLVVDYIPPPAGGGCTVYGSTTATTVAVTQPGGGSQVTLTVPTAEIVANFPNPLTLSANGNIYFDSSNPGAGYTVTATAPQTSETYSNLTITRTDTFSFVFQGSSQCTTTAANLGRIDPPCFAGSWTTTEQQMSPSSTGGASTTKTCSRTASVHGTPQ